MGIEAAEAVSFHSDGIELAGHLYRPGGATPGRRPAVVLCGGLGAIKEMIFPPIAEFLRAHGYVALAFDYRGFGASAGARNRLIPGEQARDIRSAVTYLRTLDDVDADSVCIYANSFGVGPAIVATSADRRIRGLIGVVGVARGREWLRSLRAGWQWRDFIADIETDRVQRVLGGPARWVEPSEVMPGDPASVEWARQILKEFPSRAYRLPLESAAEMLEWAPIDLVPSIGARPTLWVLADEDVLVPPAQTEEMYERAAEPKQLYRLRGAEHHDATGGPRLDEVLDQVGRWLDVHVPVAAAGEGGHA